MKINRTLRFAAALLVFTIAASAPVAGLTLTKFTTKAELTSLARVAAWAPGGYEQEWDTEGTPKLLFKNGQPRRLTIPLSNGSQVAARYTLQPSVVSGDAPQLSIVSVTGGYNFSAGGLWVELPAGAGCTVVAELQPLAASGFAIAVNMRQMD